MCSCLQLLPSLLWYFGLFEFVSHMSFLTQTLKWVDSNCAVLRFRFYTGLILNLCRHLNPIAHTISQLAAFKHNITVLNDFTDWITIWMFARNFLENFSQQQMPHLKIAAASHLISGAAGLRSTEGSS